ALEGLADHLRRAIAEEVLGARVPAAHPALRIEHHDRVVGDAFQQQPEALLAVAKTLLAAAQAFLVLAPLREVAGDLGETEELAVVVADRGDQHARPEARAVLAQPPSFVLEAPDAARGLQL